MVPHLVIEAELRRRPKLASQPLAVCARGRLRALSGAAEKAGLQVGQAQSQARAICPAAVLLPYDADLYASVQEEVLSACAGYVSTLEPTSLTELFLEAPGVGLAEHVVAEAAAAVAGLGLSCRWGVGPNRLVARIAALVRPGTAIRDGQAASFLAPLPVAHLWPLEGGTAQQLADLGFSTIELLQRAPTEVLARHFGAQAGRLRELAWGSDPTPVRPLYPPPQVTARTALPEATAEHAAVEAMLQELACEVVAVLNRRGQTCRRLSLRMETETGVRSQQCALRHPTDGVAEVLLAAQRLSAAVAPTAPVAALRLRASDLTRRTQVQLSLTEEPVRPQEGLRSAIAIVRREFGERAARWARECELSRRERMLACWQEARR